MCYNTDRELSRHKIYNKTHVIFNEFFMKDGEVYVNLTNMNQQEIEYNITFKLFSKNFYYNWCLTLYCVQGKSI